MREINILAVKDDYRGNQTLEQTIWEVKNKHFLMQTKNPDVYIVDVGIFDNNQRAFEEGVIRLINLAIDITKDNATYDCLNLILHKSDFDNVDYLSQYCRATELCVPECIIKDIICKNFKEQNLKINVYVYLFSHLDDSKITQCLKNDSEFQTLSNTLNDINETWMAYWYLAELNKILEEEIDFDTEEWKIIDPDLEEKIASYSNTDNNVRKEICNLFKDFRWDKIETNSLTKEDIMPYIKKLCNIYGKKEN